MAGRWRGPGLPILVTLLTYVIAARREPPCRCGRGLLVARCTERSSRLAVADTPPRGRIPTEKGEALCCKMQRAEPAAGCRAQPAPLHPPPTGNPKSFAPPLTIPAPSEAERVACALA